MRWAWERNTGTASDRYPTFMRYSLREAEINHYPFHIGDFIRDTVGLSLAERGAYTALLNQYYASERPLPLDARERYRMATASTKAERDAVDYVVSRYFSAGEDGMHQKRCDLELGRQRERSELAKASAMAGVEARRRIADVQRTLSERSANAQRTVSERPAKDELASSLKPLAIAVDLDGQRKEVQHLSSPEARTDEKAVSKTRVKTLGTRLTDEWRIPDEWVDWAVEIYRADRQKIVRLSLEFRDYWIGIPGSKGVKLNWYATWRNRCRQVFEV